MSTIELSFGIINVLELDLAEVIVDDGVEMDLTMVAEYHDCVLDRLQHPMFLLINKKNRYTYTFEAQQHLGNMSQIKAMAVVTYSSVAATVTKNLASRPRDTPWVVEIFPNDWAAAMAWLQKQR